LGGGTILCTDRRKGADVVEKIFLLPLSVKKRATNIFWGRCYDRNFLRFLTFSGKKLAFFSETNVMINFLNNLALF
jgi:hypothetical protein